MSLRRLPRKAATKYEREGMAAVVRAGLRSAATTGRVALLRGPRRFGALTAARHRWQRVRYDAPADPFAPIPVEVDRIAHVADLPDDLGLGLILGGDWDRRARRSPLDDHPVVQGLRQRFEEGRPWAETAYVREAERVFASGERHWGYRDLDEFLEVRCGFVDDLYERIRSEGYRPNYESGHRVPEGDVRRRATSPHSRLEPLVAIGRHGEILLRSGRHRYAIADLLDVGEIPVHVVARHRRWQAVRDAIGAAADPDDVPPVARLHLDHPDLADVAPDTWR